ncbi:MAG: tetratricopeptide repeat protein, partial [Schlesneria sp.]
AQLDSESVRVADQWFPSWDQAVKQRKQTGRVDAADQLSEQKIVFGRIKRLLPDVPAARELLAEPAPGGCEPASPTSPISVQRRLERCQLELDHGTLSAANAEMDQIVRSPDEFQRFAPSLRAEILLIRGRCAWLSGSTKNTITFWDQASELMGSGTPTGMASRLERFNFQTIQHNPDVVIAEVKRLLASLEVSGGELRPVIGHTLHCLADAIFAGNDFQESFPLAQRSLRILERVFGPGHYQLAPFHRSVANCFAVTQQPDRGIAVCQEALRTVSAGPWGRWCRIQLSATLGLCHQLKGDLDQAASAYWDARGGLDDLTGGDPVHPYAGFLELDLASLEMARCGHRDAQKHFHHARRILIDFLGQSEYRFVYELSRRGFVFSHGGRIGDAIYYYKNAAALCALVMGPNHEYTALCRKNLQMAHEREASR